MYVGAAVNHVAVTHELRSEPELRHLVAASVMLGRRLAKKRAGRACLPRRLRAGSSSAPYGAELHPPRPGVYRGALVHPHSEQSSERQGLRRGRAENRAAARILSASPHYANPPKRAERVSAVALATGLDDRRGSTYASIEGWVHPDPGTHKPGEHLSLIRRRRELRLR